MPETWRAVPGWSAYEVSDLGRVRRVIRATGCGNGGFTGIRTPYGGEYGHLWLTLRQDGRRRSVPVHRLVALAFIGEAPSSQHQVAHNDGNPTNNKVGNLRWATHAENQADRVLHGTSNRGERQHMARLRAEQIPLIRRSVEEGETQASIAARFGVARTTIMSIANGRSWSWLQ